MNYIIHLLVIAAIYLLLASSLNLMAGYSGLLSVGHAAFFGIGAYIGALAALHLGLPFPIEILLAMFLTGAVGALTMLPALRLRGDYFVIATFCFQILVFNVLNNSSFTGGPLGLPDIPVPYIGGWRLDTRSDFLLLALCACLAHLWIVSTIVKSPAGRIVTAIRDDELIARAAGKDVAAYKVQMFAISASVAALAGVIYAHYISYIDPSSFNVPESILIISMVIIGGAGTLRGPLIGAPALILLPELLRFSGLTGPMAANLRQIIYGGLLVAFMLWRPAGLLGHYSFGSRRA